MGEELTPVRRWVVFYQDGGLTPICVSAEDRHSARNVGHRARDAPVAAAVREDEGAKNDLAGLSDDVLSTESDPYRFINEVLNQ